MAAKLAPSDVYLAAVQAGFTPSQAETMTAIAGAESNYTPVDLNNNPSTGDLSYGLWQINMLGSMGPSRRASLGIRTNDALYDPATNARAAYQISGKGKDFSPWSTYTSGAYRDFLPAAAAAAKENGSAGIPPAAGSGGTTGTTQTVGATCRYPINIGLGIGNAKFCADKPVAALIIAGAGLVTLVGVAIIVTSLGKRTGAGKAVVGAAGTAATVVPGAGKVVKTGVKVAAVKGRNTHSRVQSRQVARRPGSLSNAVRSGKAASPSMKRPTVTQIRSTPRARSLPGVNAGRSNASIKARNTSQVIRTSASRTPATREAAGF